MMDYTYIQTALPDLEDALVKYTDYKDHSIYIKRGIPLNRSMSQNYCVYVEVKPTDNQYDLIKNPNTDVLDIFLGYTDITFVGNLVLDGKKVDGLFIGIDTFDNVVSDNNSEDSNLVFCDENTKEIVDELVQ